MKNSPLIIPGTSRPLPPVSGGGQKSYWYGGSEPEGTSLRPVHNAISHPSMVIQCLYLANTDVPNCTSIKQHPFFLIFHLITFPL